MSFAPRDVVAVPFPYADPLAEKRRPAVVVSSPRLEQDHGLVWLVMVTSTSTRWRGDVRVTDLEAAGLPVRCVVRPTKIACVGVQRVLRKLGTLGAADWAAVRATLARYRAAD
jgi:mRNA-degrading endonuclease toxin of MazEF toxin-antitoxin module